MIRWLERGDELKVNLINQTHKPENGKLFNFTIFVRCLWKQKLGIILDVDIIIQHSVIPGLHLGLSMPPTVLPQWFESMLTCRKLLLILCCLRASHDNCCFSLRVFTRNNTELAKTINVVFGFGPAKSGDLVDFLSFENLFPQIMMIFRAIIITSQGLRRVGNFA